MTFERNLNICIEMNEDGFTKVGIHEPETGDYVSRKFQYCNNLYDFPNGIDDKRGFEYWLCEEISSWIDMLNEEREETRRWE